jgi:hypothetical protein
MVILFMDGAFFATLVHEQMGSVRSSSHAQHQFVPGCCCNFSPNKNAKNKINPSAKNTTLVNSSVLEIVNFHFCKITL